MLGPQLPPEGRKAFCIPTLGEGNVLRATHSGRPATSISVAACRVAKRTRQRCISARTFPERPIVSRGRSTRASDERETQARSRSELVGSLHTLGPHRRPFGRKDHPSAHRGSPDGVVVKATAEESVELEDVRPEGDKPLESGVASPRVVHGRSPHRPSGRAPWLTTDARAEAGICRTCRHLMP